ncbi:MAG: HAMP domain-containing sensor histidine kinase, partial [Pseudomonadota bacterium]
VRRAATIALGSMVLTALLLTLILGRRAVRRLDKVTDATSRIVAGDLSQRLPESGNGDEYDRLSAAVNAILGRVETLNSGVRSVSDNIAHDLRTPLTRLRNKAETALSRVEPGATDAIEDIVGEADSLIATFDAVLLISQTQSGARAIPMVDVDLKALVEDIHELFEPMAGHEQVTLDIQCEPAIAGNRELLARALSNLIDNALKYAGSRKSLAIELKLSCANGKAKIAVSDNGPGIAEADRQKALARFGRLEDSRNKPGSGLGLALVDATMRAHGGQLQLEDNEPGLRAIMELPISRQTS